MDKSAINLLDTDAWAQIQGGKKPADFVVAWFELLSQFLGQKINQGVVVLGAPGKGPFSPVGLWPKDSSASPGLVLAIEAAISRQSSVIPDLLKVKNAQPDQGHCFALPLLVDEKICGAVALEISELTEANIKSIAAAIQWNAGWLEILIRRSKYTVAEKLVSILELVASVIHYEKFQAAATTVATELANKLGCERVSLGFLKDQHAVVSALSHNASFSKMANLVRDIENMMDEAIDQHCTITLPAVDAEASVITRQHEAFLASHGSKSICTIPFTEGETLLGAMVLEWSSDEVIDETTVQFCQHAASLLGPLLESKRKNDRWLVQKAGDSFKSQVTDLIGPKHALKKMWASVALLLTIFFVFAESEYRITADARLEGAVRRAISVPMSGYIAEANVRAGDIVKSDEPLFRLDDRDLRLENLKWESQKIQHRREHSEALANHETAQALILKTQIDQAEAQLALINEQLERIKVTAPFDSIVVMGDLSQSLGAPVERGEVVFEVAPLDDYRVVLNVDERDIHEIMVAQEGVLVLSGAPDTVFTIQVTRITPVSNAEAGLNFFKVEAQLKDADLSQLRPGMEGIGKVNIESRKIAWIWTHRINHWLRMFFWSWWP